jgi:hypothetical protein
MEFEQTVHALVEQAAAQELIHEERENELQDELLAMNENLMTIVDIIAPHDRCQSDDECLNGGSCASFGVCVCAKGYQGTFCNEDVDECEADTHSCGDHGACRNIFGSYECDCNEGYMFSEGSCVDYDECTQGDLCGPNSRCENTVGSYDCGCENDCQFMRSSQGIGCDPTWFLTEWSDWGEGCSCDCGKGEKIQTRVCNYYEGDSFFNCEHQTSDVDGDNPCDNAHLEQTVTCEEKTCEVTWLKTQTSNVNYADTKDKVTITLYDDDMNECVLSPMTRKEKNYRKQGGADTFDDKNNDSPDFPFKCKDLCLKSPDSLLKQVSVVNDGSNGWKWEWMNVKLNGNNNYVYDDGVNWFKNGDKQTYSDVLSVAAH